jgi:glycolate oxidase FAD binding subunit
MADSLKPDSAEQLAEAVAQAVADKTPLEVIGRGSKRALGRPVNSGTALDLSGFSGITLYEPEELVLRADAATPMTEIEAALADKGQMLAFEPPDLGPVLGQPAGGSSIGGVISCNLSGPRRVTAGAARDHFLGFTAVSGRGEIFTAGSRVMKNVTGYDMMKLMAGAYGTLAAMTSVTVKVLPRPEKTYSLLLYGLDVVAAGGAMRQALGSSYDVSGAAYIPANLVGASQVSYVSEQDRSVTAFRLEGPGPSVTHRLGALRHALADFGAAEELHSKNSVTLWRELRDLAFLAGESARPLWRLSVAPDQGPSVAQDLGQRLPDSQILLDWGGGLIWLVLPNSGDAAAAAVRGALPAGGGHATLLRAQQPLRAAVPVFQPQAPALAALSARVKAGFDPAGVLNPGRMYEGV